MKKILMFFIMIFNFSLSFAQERCFSDCDALYPPLPMPEREEFDEIRLRKCKENCRQAIQQQQLLKDQTEQMHRQSQLLEEQVEQNKQLNQKMEELEQEMEDQNSQRPPTERKSSSGQQPNLQK